MVPHAYGQKNNGLHELNNIDLVKKALTKMHHARDQFACMMSHQTLQEFNEAIEAVQAIRDRIEKKIL